MQNRVFFAQAAIDQWAIDGRVDLAANELILLADGRHYKVVEAVHVLAEVTGAADAHGIVGKVKPKAALEELGAEILENSMIIGDNAYDVVPGWVGAADRSFAEHLTSPEREKARDNKTDPGAGLRSDEELLKLFADGAL